MANNELLWTPTNPNDTNMFRFISYINTNFKLDLKTYNDLREFSVTELSKFWSSVWSFCNIKSSMPFDKVIDESIPINKLPKWFKGARLNYAENLLRRTDDHTAIIGLGETLSDRKISFKELSLKVGQVSEALRRAGVKVGDRVAGLVPNCPDAAIFMLASACIGAVWSSASPDFGPTGILDRFSQIEPKILVSVEAVMYNGKVHDNLKKLAEVAKSLTTVEKVIVMPFIGTPIDISFVEKSVLLGDFLKGVEEQYPVYEQLPFDHPLAILFSSGTTGVPKCIVHSQGGTLIQHLKEHIIHGSMGPKDVFFYYSTTGWMMWNWLLSGLATGATVILYDGNPVRPEVNRLWKMVEEYKVTIFGTSAKYLQNLEEVGYHPNSVDLSSLHSIYSTGSELKPKSFEFIYKHIKKDLLVGSITGGTDIISLFAGHCSSLPVHKGEIQCRSLGMAIEAWDESGKSVLDAPGDLVCTKPFPCMPIYFYNDKDGKKYQSAYFTQMKGVWYHGDYMQINSKTGGVTMLGRRYF
jgi:acetoacetyl-CoA synthetase